MAIQVSKPKLILGKPLTGPVRATHAQFSEALMSDNPAINPPSMMEAACLAEAMIAEKAMEEKARGYFEGRRVPMTFNGRSRGSARHVECVDVRF